MKQIRAKCLFLLVTLLFSSYSFAQEDLEKIVDVHKEIEKTIEAALDTTAQKIWKFGGNTTLTFSQVALTKSWIAGGENSISANAGVLLTANYHKELTKWESTLDLGFGLAKQGEQAMIKNEDKIDFSSQYGRKASEKWFYSALLGFKTQFYEGYKYPDVNDVISDFMAPAYLMVSAGMDYKPNDKFNMMLSPLTGRLTIVNNQQLADVGAFGVTPGENTRAEMGGFVKISYNDQFWEDRLTLRTKLELFSNYIEKPENVDFYWEVSLILKLSNYITARLSTFMMYDDDAIPELQFKEVFGVGFGYKF
jgi:hypothetical protein